MLEIEYVTLDKIQPYIGNAKKHPEAQIRQIEQSIMANKAGISEKDIVARAAQKVGVKTENMAGFISKYARSNYGETIAEASADVYCNGAKASKASTAIVNEIKAILR